METCEDITLLELFDQYMNTHQAVCVKVLGCCRRQDTTVQNIPVKANMDSLLNFVEVFLKTKVIAIYSPLSDTAKCVVVVLEKPIKVLTSSEVRKLEGTVIALTELGQAEGLFIRGVPEEASDEFLELYFESTKSSGRPGCVSKVRSCKCCLDRMVVVVIKDTSVVRKILNKRPHPSLDKYDLQLEPYFPALHEDLLKNHAGRSVAVSDLRDAWEKVRQHASCEKPKEQHEDIKPALLDRTYNNKAGEIDQKVRQEKKSLSRPEGRGIRTSSSSKLKIYTDDKDSAIFVETETNIAVEQSKNTKFTHDSIPISSQNSDRLRHTHANVQDYVCQSKNQITPIDDRGEATYSTQDPVSGDLYVGIKDEREHGKKKAGKPVARSRQRLDKMEDYSDTELSDATFSEQASLQKGFHMESKNLDLDSKAVEIVAVDMPKTNIVLLKINGFTKRCGNCKVRLVEKQGHVEFEGAADAIIQSKLRMDEILQDVEKVTRSMPKHHVQYISKSEGYLRFQFTKRRIGAVIVSNVEEATVCSMAFTTQKAENGLEFIMKELVSKPLTLRKGQSQYFERTEWDHILDDLQKTVQVTVIKEDNNVDIVAFKEPSVNAARQKIIEFLKESQPKVPKVRTQETLKGASARCFSHYFLEDLKTAIRRHNGKLECYNEGTDVLKIEVEGDESLSKLVKDKITLIWHEKVDFKKITTDVNDLWLLMKGIGSEKGKDLLQKFEKDHVCFTEVTKIGEVSLPIVVAEGIEASESENSYPQAVIRERHSLSSASKGTLGRTKANEFNLGLTDKEALRLALVASSSDSALDTPRFGLQRSYSTEYLNKCDTNDGWLTNAQPGLALSEVDEIFPVRQLQKQTSRQFGSTKVTVKQGCIATDMISNKLSVAKVNVLSPTGDLGKESVISKAFANAGGQELFQNYESAKLQSSLSNVVVTAGTRTLNCDFVLHVKLNKTARPNTIVPELMRECFKKCSINGCSCIAFPPLGVGRLYKYQPSVVAKCMIDEIRRQTQTNGIQEITIIIYDKDEDTYLDFEATLKDATLHMHENYFSSPFSLQKNRNIVANIPSSVPLHYEAARYPPVINDTVKMPKPVPAPRLVNEPYTTRQAEVHKLRVTSRAASPGGTQRLGEYFSSPITRIRTHTDPQKALGYRRANLQRKITSKDPPRQNMLIYSRDDQAEEDLGKTREAQTQRRPVKKPRERSPPGEPAVKYRVDVFSRDKLSCERARNELGKQLKSHFLHEIKLERRGKLSRDCKKKIRDALRKWNVKSFLIPGSKNYVIKGEEQAVSKAYSDILKIILEFKDSETSAEARKARRSDLRKKPDEYVKHMALEHNPDVPTYWKNFNSGSPINIALTKIKTLGKDFIKVNLETHDMEYKAIVSLISTNWDVSKVGQGKDARGLQSLGYSAIRVTKIQRVENLQLFDQYVHRRKHIFLNTHKRKKHSCKSVANLQGSGGSVQTVEFQRCRVFEDELCPEVNEHFLFHGTTPDTVDVICNAGLDSRLGNNQAMYGPGIYGTESPTKADQYADPKDSRTNSGRKMFLMRMVLGESFLCTDHNPPKYRRPPCAQTGCFRDDCKDSSHGRFDSVIGQSGRLFREFVVYQPDQCYPEYIISYDRV